MGERPDFNRVVIDSIVRSVQHERNCGCERCMGKARQSIAWVNEQSPTTRYDNAKREQEVIDILNKQESPELRELRLQNMMGGVAIGLIYTGNLR